MNPFKKLAGQTAIYGLPTIVGRLLNYLLVPLYTRVFQPSEYGIVTEMYAYVSFLFVILTYGMETAFFRYSNNQQEQNKVFGTSIFALTISSLSFVLLIFLLSGQIANGIGYPDNPEYIRWFGLILAADALSSIPYAKLRLENKALKFAFIKISNIIANIFFNLLFIVLFPYLLKHYNHSEYIWLIKLIYNPEIGVGYIFISNLIASLLTFFMLLPGIRIKQIKPDYPLLKDMLKYAWPLLIFGLAGIINETFDRIILKYLLPSGTNAMAQLGVYGACYKVSILMTLFIQTFRYAAEPFFFDQAGKRNAQHTYSKLMHYFIIVCLTIYLLITLNIDFVLLFIGPEYREGAAVIPILLWANLFLGVFYNLSIWFKLTDRTKTGALISIAGAAITLTLNFILIPILGYLGAAWATFACYASMMIISWILGQKYYPVGYNLKAAGFYTLLTIVIYSVSLYINHIGTPLKITINLMLILIFMVIVFIREKGFAKVKSINS